MATKFNLPKTESLNEIAERKAVTSKIIGKPKNGKKFIVKSGDEILSNPRAVNIMFIGEIGSGKSHSVVDILLMGYKVFYISTDFGKAGEEAISNYFAMHSEEAHYYRKNFRILTPSKEDAYDCIIQFMRNPEDVDPEIYNFDPDFLFWDGLSSYQQNDVEAKFAADADDVLMDDADWNTWRSTRNATLFPLNDFLELHNPKTGKPWHHIVTTLEQKKGEKVKVTGSNGKPEWDTKPGTEKIKPLLHTSAEKISLAGFSIAIRTIRQYMANEDKTTFIYENRGKDLQLKDRNYGLPVSISPASFRELWEKYILPRIKPIEKEIV